MHDKTIERYLVAAAVALHLVADMAIQPEKAAALLLAATGRRALHVGFWVL